MNQSIVSIVLCTFNRYEHLFQVVNSIDKQTASHTSFELIVVDNSSDLVSQDRFCRNFVVEYSSNYIVERIAGLSRARNIGVAAARGDIVAFIDDDAIAHPAWIEEIIRSFGLSPDIAVVGGPVRPIWPTARPAWLHKDLEGFLTILDLGPDERALAPGEWLAGTNIAYRKSTLVEAGGFNEQVGRVGKILMSNEEVIISQKIKAAGGTLFYNPRMAVDHRVHAERISQPWLRRRVFWQVISEILSEGDGYKTDSRGSVERILAYIEQAPRHNRGIGGLLAGTEDAKLFERQTVALASLVRLLALDGSDLAEIMELAQ